MTATGFSSSLGKLHNLAYIYVLLLYVYDYEEGPVVSIKHNNTIYMGDNMDDSLSNSMQLEEDGVRVDIRPKY